MQIISIHYTLHIKLICIKTNKNNTYKNILKIAGVKPYSCDVCSKRYASKSGLNAHCKKHHPINWKNKQKIST